MPDLEPLWAGGRSEAAVIKEPDVRTAQVLLPGARIKLRKKRASMGPLDPKKGVDGRERERISRVSTLATLITSDTNMGAHQKK